jgi:hypothetical protein
MQTPNDLGRRPPVEIRIDLPEPRAQQRDRVPGAEQVGEVEDEGQPAGNVDAGRVVLLQPGHELLGGLGTAQVGREVDADQVADPQTEVG